MKYLTTKISNVGYDTANELHMFLRGNHHYIVSDVVLDWNEKLQELTAVVFDDAWKDMKITRFIGRLTKEFGAVWTKKETA